jgi:hypothetical protein
MSGHETYMRARSIQFLAELFNEEVEYSSGLDDDKDEMVDALLNQNLVSAMPSGEEEAFDYTVALTENGSRYFDSIMGVMPPVPKPNEKALKEQQAATELLLTAALKSYCENQDLPLISADDLYSELADQMAVLNEQRKFMAEFINQWEANENLV